jgi:hypothetical protein
MVRSVLAGAAAAALLACVAEASAASGRDRDLGPWATVNVCDTAMHPDAIGVRARMPALGRRGERLALRIRVQWRDADGAWRLVGAAGDSGWVRLGRPRGRFIETGRLFRYEAPPEGATQLLRGHVTFAWTVRGRVVRTRTAVTERGHRSGAGSDPPGYSAATCELTSA